MHTNMLWYSRERVSKTDTEEKKLLNKVVIFKIFTFILFIYFLHTKNILIAS